MEEKVAVFDMTNVSPRQRMNHAHIRGDLIHFHVHDPEKEPKQPEALVLRRRDLWRVMDVNYWKKEASVGFEPSHEANAVGAEVRMRDAVFRWKKGKQTKEDEISLLSLRQVDARLRFRVRDVRGVPKEAQAGLPPGYKEHDRIETEKAKAEEASEEAPEPAEEEGEAPEEAAEEGEQGKPEESAEG